MMLAGFATEDAMLRAISRLRQEGVSAIETYSPAPPPDLAGPPTRGSWTPLFVLFVGVAWAGVSFMLQTVSSVSAYPMDIGGHPNFSWPAFVPNVFENAAALAVIGGFAAFLFACRLPRLYEPIDESEEFRRATRDRCFVAVRHFDVAWLRALFQELGAETIEELEA